MKFLVTVAAAVAIDPLLGGQAIWGTDPARPFGLTAKEWLSRPWVMAPYVPLQIVPVFGWSPMPEDQARARTDRRYANSRLREDCYGTVTVKDLG